MALERKHDLAELYQLYEGRCPQGMLRHPSLESSSVRKIDLRLDRNVLTHHATRDMPKIAKDYDAVHKGDAANTQWDGPFGSGEARILHIGIFPDNKAIVFSGRKSFRRMHDDAPDTGTYPPHSPGKESESIFFEFYHNSHEMGGYRLDRGMDQAKHHEWALNHRMVIDTYREQGLGAVLMTTTESFVQNMADLTGTKQKLTANIGQPSLLLMFLNKGFVARSEEDQRRIDRVLNADQNLELDYSVTKHEDGQWKQQKHKDLYVFAKDTTLKSEVNAFRINLEKTFQPHTSAVDTGISSTRDKAKKTTDPEILK